MTKEILSQLEQLRREFVSKVQTLEIEAIESGDVDALMQCQAMRYLLSREVK
jgi:hypothetical protein